MYKPIVVSTFLVLVLSFSNLHAQSAAEVKRCDRAIPVSVPAFSCSSGVNIPKVIDSMGHCDQDEVLNNRCVENSKLGRLKANNSDDVEIVFSCRNKTSGDVADDAPVTYYDIAVVQHDPKTGATCFYQHFGDHDGENIPAPNSAQGPGFWGQSVDYCARCHTNGAFVRTPHYWDVVQADGTHVLPKKPRKPELEPYSLINSSSFQVASIERSNNACVDCHQIGAYRKNSTSAWEMGKINEVASGQWRSLGGPSTRSQTHDGFDDFMADHVQGGRPAAKKALQDLEDCLVPSSRRPDDCQLQHIFTEPYRRKGGAGGIRFQTRNLNINSQGMDGESTLLVAAGVSIPIPVIASIDINHNCKSCGTAINQIIVGIAGEKNARACIWSGGRTSNGWITRPFSLGLAPSKRGVYDIRVRYAQAFSCETALSWWTVDTAGAGPNENYTIGTLTVK